MSSTSPPSAVGVSYAADVLHFGRQLILVVRETVTSHTLTCFISDERATTLEEALIALCVTLRAVDGPLITVRVDPAPGFVALSGSEALHQAGIKLEVGRVHNPNKNPCAEHAIGELRGELKRVLPEGGPVSVPALAVATSRLNSRLRRGGLSAFERLFSRDQYSYTALSTSDRDLIAEQQSSRLQNHPYDYVSKGRTHSHVPPSVITPGVLVYHAGDRDKARARPRYLVTSVDGDWCRVRKFANSQLRTKSYKFHVSECYTVPTTPTPLATAHSLSASSSDEDVPCPVTTPPLGCPVPAEISGGTLSPPSHSPPAHSPPPIAARRDRRNIRLPSRFDDFVLDPW